MASELSFHWNPLLTFLCLVLGLAWLAHPTMLARSRWPLYRFLLWPGIAIHEMSHAIVAKLLGAKVHEIELFHRDGGYVTHGPTKLSYLGDFLVGIAPLFGGLAAYAGLAYWLLGDAAVAALAAVSHAPFAQEAWQAFFAATPWSAWQTYAFLFVFLNMGVAIAPSWQDLKNGRAASIAFFVIGALVGVTGFGAAWLERTWLPALNGGLALAAAGLIIAWLFWASLGLLARALKGK